MARLITFIALIGLTAVSAKPTPGELPSIMLGVFENVHERQTGNFMEFVSIHELPESYFTRENKIGYFKEGDKYVQRYLYWPKIIFDLPFKLNQPGPLKVNKHDFEYVFTLEEGPNNQPILRTKFREANSGDIKFVVEQLFSDEGIEVTYTRENIVAKRFYRRAIPSFALGAFEADQSTVSDEDLRFYNQHFPMPDGVQWTKDMSFYLGKKGDRYIDMFIPNPEYRMTIPFKLNKIDQVKVGNSEVSYKYNITESTPEKLTLVAEITVNDETSVYTNVFTSDGTMKTTCKTSKGEYEVTFKKVVPWWFHGKFEDLADKAENWAEFVKGHEALDQTFKYMTMKRESQNEFKVTKETANGQEVDVPFKLNTPGEVTYPNGKKIKYHVTMDFVEDYPVLRSQDEMEGGEKFEVAIIPPSPRTPYFTMVFKRGNVVAKRFCRRVLSPMISGKFESNEESEEYKKFSQATGTPNIVSVEFSTNDEGKLVKKGTTKDGKTTEYVMEFGKPKQFTYNGKTFESTNNAFGGHKKPFISAMYKEVDGPLNFMVVNRFSPDKMTMTVTYGGNVTVYGEHVVKRVYNRVGAPVNL